ncbi:putative nucleic acid-binding, replication factor A [Helianthus annuus]|nr:putative nucleic acid-binding, replication factor A [Helianthus annuus]
MMQKIVDVKPNQMPLPLHIRVIKKWKTQTMDYLKSQTTDQDLCYLFEDKHGTAIEATANPKKEADFDSKLKIGSCYKVSAYIAIKSRDYMKVVPHGATLRLGATAVFEPLHDDSIPTYYYNFATYDTLASRKANRKPLTDYIGRVENVSPPLRRAGKVVKKVKIQDEWLVITFWAHTMFPYEKENAMGQLLAVTATMVTVFEENLQLESTDATTAVLNPPIPELQSYIYKFSKLERSETVGQKKPVLPIAEIKAKYKQDTTQTKFTCKATVTEITEDRKWFYTTCPKCKGKVHLQRAEIPRFVCEDACHIPDPSFMYFVNTTIEDESDKAKAVFFNEAIEQMLKKSCYNMVVKDGNTDPEIIPADIYKLRGKTAVLDISVKQDNSMAVNKAGIPPAIFPATPDPKTTTTKRGAPDSPDGETPGKQAKK